MKDGYGREIDYLRISLTDKCNLRCAYCMPAEGIRHLDHKDILSIEETGRIAGIMAGMGIKRVRLTGGEPLVRKGVTELIRILRDDCGMQRISMTTNGMLLDDTGRGYAVEELINAGLDDINISLDTLNEDIFKRLTGTEGVSRVIRGIERALSSGLKVKLNCVPIRGINERELPELVRFADKAGVDLRFIELMPIGCGRDFEGLGSDEVIDMLESAIGVTSMEVNSSRDGYEEDTDGPAKYRIFNGTGIRVGFISPISHGFCKQCNRIRLTASGYLKLCLQYPDGADLKTLLRSGASDDEIMKIISSEVLHKPKGHSFGIRDGNTDIRKMVQIGG